MNTYLKKVANIAENMLLIITYSRPLCLQLCVLALKLNANANLKLTIAKIIQTNFYEANLA